MWWAWADTSSAFAVAASTPGISMSQQPALTGKNQHRGVFQQCGVAGLHQACAHQEVAVALHDVQIQLQPCGMQQVDTTALETAFQDQGVIANPHLKQITQRPGGADPR